MTALGKLYTITDNKNVVTITDYFTDYFRLVFHVSIPK